MRRLTAVSNGGRFGPEYAKNQLSCRLDTKFEVMLEHSATRSPLAKHQRARSVAFHKDGKDDF